MGATDDELNALAVEEDKRRRNTAASARFRIKKKQREAALESTAKELRDKVSSLEREVEALKTENGWLRGLIVGFVSFSFSLSFSTSLSYSCLSFQFTARRNQRGKSEKKRKLLKPWLKSDLE